MVATVLPALIILGIFTFVRLVETKWSIVFLKRIETIRRYYATLDPAAARFFATPGGTASTAALASIGMRASLAEMLFTSASMIAAVISILAGVGAALLLDTAGLPLPAAVTVAVVVAFSNLRPAPGVDVSPGSARDDDDR